MNSTTAPAIILSVAALFTSACGEKPKPVVPPVVVQQVYALPGTYVGSATSNAGSCGALGEVTLVVDADTTAGHYYVTHHSPTAAPYFPAMGPQLAWQESTSGVIDSCPGSVGGGGVDTTSTYSLALDDSGNLLGTVVIHTLACGTVTNCSWQIALERQ